MQSLDIGSFDHTFNSIGALKFINSNSVTATSDSFEFLTSMLRDTNNCLYKQPSSVLNSDPMLNSCNNFRYNNSNSNNNNYNSNEDGGSLFDISNTNRWMNKPIREWIPEDVLFWISHEASKYGVDMFESCLPNFCLLNGNELINLTVDDFINKIPSNRKFAAELHKRLQYIKHCKSVSNNDFQNIINCNSDAGLLRILKSCSISNETNKSYNDEYNLMNIGYTDISNNQHYTDNCLSADLKPDGDSGVDSGSDSEQGYGGENNSFEHLENMELLKSDDKNNIWEQWDDMAAKCLKNTMYSDDVAKNENDDGISVSSLEDKTKTDELPSAPIKKRPGRPRGIKKKKPEKVGRLWEFLRDLLHNPQHNPSIICWDDYEIGTFRFVHSDRVAGLWGQKKDNPQMTFEKFSRAMRYYYKRKVLIAVQKRLVYQFGENATKWRSPNPILG